MARVPMAQAAATAAETSNLDRLAAVAGGFVSIMGAKLGHAPNPRQSGRDPGLLTPSPGVAQPRGGGAKVRGGRPIVGAWAAVFPGAMPRSLFALIALL